MTRTVSTRPGPPLRRKRRAAHDITRSIVRAAADEFKRCGFAGAATAAIARRADVTEAQLFRYFGSKANLFRETIFNPLEQHFRRFIDHHIPDLRHAAGVRSAAHLYTTELQDFIREHAQMLTPLVVAQLYDFGTTHAVGGIDSLDIYFDRTAAMMQSRIRGEPLVDPAIMVRVAFAAVLACVLFKDWMFPPGLASDEKITAAVNHFVLEGIGVNHRERHSA